MRYLSLSLVLLVLVSTVFGQTSKLYPLTIVNMNQFTSDMDLRYLTVSLLLLMLTGTVSGQTSKSK